MSENKKQISESVSDTKKKGRKPKQTNYFDVREENAVVDFLNTDDYYEKNKIYNEFLRKPLDKMISSIIRRYKLYRKDTDFDEVHNDTHSFLMTKINKFVPAKQKKAYSYFGTICKNYLMGQMLKDQKELKRRISYEDISPDLENDSQFSYTIDNYDIESEQIIRKFTKELQNLFECDCLTENEMKLGHALHDLFENYQQVFIGTSNNKFNKNVILLSLREMTNLNTKEIRAALKKFKSIYLEMLKNIIE